MEKGCPNCGRMINAENKVCPYCNYDFGQLNKMFTKYEEEKLKEILGNLPENGCKSPRRILEYRLRSGSSERRCRRQKTPYCLENTR